MRPRVEIATEEPHSTQPVVNAGYFGFVKIFASGTVYGSVAPHAYSPSNFPHSEDEAKQPGRICEAFSARAICGSYETVL
jgi:hypothetical protein